MAEPRITLEQLKSLGVQAVSYAKQLKPPGKVVLIRTIDGKVFHVSGARLTNKGSHVIIGDGKESVILRAPSRLSRAVRLTTILAGLAGSMVALITVLMPSPTLQIQTRLDQLAAVQRSLRELDAYVAGQRSTLQHLSDDLERLQRERATLSLAAQIDREKAQALLEYQALSQRRREWLSVGLSFIVGVLSSVAATLLLRYARRFRRSEERVLTEKDA